jgi:DNA-binding NarL/FixJ family response regulator
MGIVTSLLLISRHRLISEGLRALFEAQPGLTVVGEVADSPQALEMAERTRPEVIVIDLIAQVLNGLAVIRDLKARAPRSAIVALSMCTEDSYVCQALQNGARAYVLKSDRFADLLDAIREVAAGRLYLSAGLDAEAIRQQLATGSHSDPFARLTAREQQVLQLSAQGLTSSQIAAQLGIRRRTAEAHRANIYKKLELTGHADLVSFALRRGLLTRDL